MDRNGRSGDKEGIVILRTKLIVTIAVGAALMAPVAQAQRPDDRAGARGPGAIDSSQAPAVTHPDNRAGARGPGALEVQRAAARPDDRAGSRGPGAIGTPGYSTTDHPDNRAGARGPGASTRILIHPGSSGFDWSDALIGGLGGAGMALLLTGSAFLLMSQRQKPRTA
jgi:hypothetical protein